MRNIVLALASTVSMTFGIAVGSAEATPLGAQALAPPEINDLVQKTQYYYDGREYCWYPGGWHGPGYYWCGYAYRRGYGWGGVYGWNGWGRPGYRPGPYGRFYGGRGPVRGGYRRG